MRRLLQLSKPGRTERWLLVGKGVRASRVVMEVREAYGSAKIDTLPAAPTNKQ